MTTISVHEIQRDPLGILRRVEDGETLLVLRDEQPVAEIKPVAAEEYLPRQRELHGITSLPVDEGAFVHLARLPPLHRDPFDRILLAQALEYDMTLVTVDPAVLAYPVVKLLTA